MRYCTHCGNPLKGTERFCVTCGAPVKPAPQPVASPGPATPHPGASDAVPQGNHFQDNIQIQYSHSGTDIPSDNTVSFRDNTIPYIPPQIRETEVFDLPRSTLDGISATYQDPPLAQAPAGNGQSRPAVAPEATASQREQSSAFSPRQKSAPAPDSMPPPQGGFPFPQPAAPPPGRGGGYPPQQPATGYPAAGEPPLPRSAPAQPQTPKRRLLPLPLILAALLAAAGVGFYFYGSRLAGDPQTDIAALVGAIRTGDAAGVTALTCVPTPIVLGDTGLAPLLRLGEREYEEHLDALSASLLGQLAGAPPAKGCEAFILESEKTLLFFTKYHIVMKPVALQLTNITSGSVPYVSGNATGRVSAQPLHVTGLLPGVYDTGARWQHYDMDLSSERAVVCLGDAEADVSIPAIREVAMPCGELPLTLSINGIDTGITATDGVLRFAAARGMTLRFAMPDESLFFEWPLTDPAELNDFDLVELFAGASSHTGESGAHGTDDAVDNRLALYPFAESMTGYFRSYLEAINAQDASFLSLCTEGQRERAAERVTNPLNAENVFYFSGVAIDLDTLEYATRPDGTYFARMLVNLRYRYVARSDLDLNVSYFEWEEGGNHQWCEMTETPQGEWLCDFTEITDRETLSGNLAVFP